MSTNQRGVTLIAILVGLGILGIVMLGITQMINIENRSRRIVSSRTKINETILQAMDQLRHPERCTEVLGGESFDANPATLNQRSLSAINFPKPEQEAHLWIKPGTTLDEQAKVQLVELKNLTKRGPNQFSANLHIQFDITGSPFVVRLIPLDLTTAPNVPPTVRIVSCELARAEVSTLGYVRAKSVGGQRVENRTDTRLNFNQQIQDHNDEFDALSSVFTASQPGLYQITANVTFDSRRWSAGEFCRIIVFKNATETLDSDTQVMPQGRRQCQAHLTTTVELSLGDSIEIYGSGEDAGEGTLLIATNPAASLSITHLR